MLHLQRPFAAPHPRWTRIRFQVNTRGRGLRATHFLRFTFLLDDDDIHARFEDMADEIRARIREYFNYGDNERHVYLLHFEPADERAANTRQRTVRTIQGITGMNYTKD